jgi:hypothetical protein
VRGGYGRSAVNPADHGYHERRADSGVWYKDDAPHGLSFTPRTCAHPGCGKAFMARRVSGSRVARFCCRRCSNTAPERQPGESTGRSPLIGDDIRAIRASRDTDAKLADDWGVCRQTINAIRTRKTWRHIK